MEKLIDKYIEGSITESEEQTLFSWINASDENKRDFLRYRQVILASRFRKEKDKVNIDSELDFFQQRIGNKRKAKTRKRVFYLSATIAASLALFAYFYIGKGGDTTSDIVRYSENLAPISDDLKETTLTLKEGEVITIEEDESNISYNEEGLVVNSKNAISLGEEPTYNELQTPYGKRSKIIFSDSTVLWANAKTKVVYPVNFDKDKREIYVDGEVLLKVKKDTKRPFIVKTSDIDIKVLGTTFNVNAYSEDHNKSVILVDGSVEVSGLRKSTVLNPNTQYLLDIESKQSDIQSINAKLAVSWASGVYHFQREPLANVLARLAKYYGKQITCDEKAKNFLCSGSLNLRDDVEEILWGLCHTVPVEYKEIEVNHYLITLKK